MPVGFSPRKIKICIAFVAGLFLLLSGWALLSHSPSQPIPPTFEVSRQNIQSTVLASGILQPIRQVDVGSQASGQLTALWVNPGDFVTKGQLLGEIDPTLSQNALQDAQVALNSLLAQKKANQAQVKRSTLMLQRQQAMYKQDAAARQDVEAAQADLQVQQAQLTAMNAQIHQQQIRVATAETNLSYTQIMAPVSGTVLSVSTQAGQTVVASYQVPVILEIADLSIMTVRAQIPEADISLIHQGQSVCFTTLGAAHSPFCSTIKALEPDAEKINNAIFFNALFDVDNPAGYLRPAMTAQVSVVLNEAENVLAIPVTALGASRSAHGYQVKTVNNAGDIAEKTILTGIDNGIQIEVKQGLRDGERVLLVYDSPGVI